jgi:hypothetical protein
MAKVISAAVTAEFGMKWRGNDSEKLKTFSLADPFFQRVGHTALSWCHALS